MQVVYYLLLFVLFFVYPNICIGEQYIKYYINNKAGFKDERGYTLIDPKYDDILFICAGLLKVKNNGKWGIIDTKDRYIADTIYDEIGEFCYYNSELGYSRNLKYTFIKFQGKVGLIEDNGRIYIEPEFDSAGKSTWHNDIQTWHLNDKFREWRINAFNGDFIFKHDKKYVETRISDAKLVRFSNNGLYGFTDRGNRVVINPEYDKVQDFSEGYAGVKKGDKWGFIDESGKIVLPCIYDDVYEYKNEIARIKMEDKWGYVNNKGSIVVKPTYDYVWEYDGVKAKVRVGDKITYIFIQKEENLLSTKGVDENKVIEDNIKSDNNIGTASIKNDTEILNKKLVMKGMVGFEEDALKWTVKVKPPWDEGHSTEGGFKFSKGEMVGENAIAVLKDSNKYSENVSIEASMASITNSGTFNIYFRIVDFSNLYMFSLRPGEINPRYKVSFWKRKNGMWSLLGGGIPFNFSTNDEYRVRVDIKGSEFTGYINGEMVEKVSDISFDKGDIGFEAFASKAKFRNIKIGNN